MIDNKTLTLILKNIKDEIGLDKFNVRVNEDFLTSNTLVDFFVPISLSDLMDCKSDNEIYKLLSDIIVQPILNSVVVSDKIAPLKDQINKLGEDICRLQDEVKNLNKYKDYYDMHYKMQHGDET